MPDQKNEPAVYMQAHRGGLDEVPENTLAALQHAWSIPGAIPEVDLRTTKDGVIVCIHDKTPRRTTDAPDDWADTPIGEIPLARLRSWDAGRWFDPKYAGERTPTIDELLTMAAEDERRQLYLDLKDVHLDYLLVRIADAGLRDRVIWVHGDVSMCKDLQKMYDGARTMTWLSGLPGMMKRRFAELAETGFEGISQLQFHLPSKKGDAPIEYLISLDYLREAKQKTDAAGVDLQLRPFEFDAASLRPLIDAGIRWYVADAPRKFADAAAAAG